MFSTPVLAFIFGLLAASGLLIGAFAGITFKPNRKLTATIMAFGSGALLSALAFELVEEAFEKSGALPLITGFIIGGILFLAGNHIIDGLGGFMRNNSNRQRFVHKQKRKLATQIITKLSQIDILRSLPPEEVHGIVLFTEIFSYQPGQHIFEQGDEGDALYLIDSGEVNILAKQSDGSTTKIATLGPGQTFGEMALLTKETRSATAEAITPIEVYRIRKHDFERLMSSSPKLATAVSQLLAQRLTKTTAKQSLTEHEADHWRKLALKSTEEKTVSQLEEKTILEKHLSPSASLAIFLGAMIDGIPESIVIGAGMIASGLPVAFFMAVLLSNFPEGMSSASGMFKSGFTKKRIYMLWGGLVILSGIASFLGNVLLTGAPGLIIAFVQAIAAGGILAMLANTMMPEAYELGGTTVALATIVGFLCSFLLSCY